MLSEGEILGLRLILTLGLYEGDKDGDKLGDNEGLIDAEGDTLGL